MPRAALYTPKLRNQIRLILAASAVFCVYANVFIISSLQESIHSPTRLDKKDVPGIPKRPLMIPRIIHHTFRNRQGLTREQRSIMKTWVNLNPDWEIMYHEDADCLRLVEKHYPSYLQLFKTLPRNVERADFFRYLVLHHYGGVYVDVDVECVIPLEHWLGSDVHLVIGIEHEFSGVVSAMERSYPRRRQYQQWAIISSKGQPLFQMVLQRMETQFQTELVAQADGFRLAVSDRSTFERTGPALWTDVVTSYIDSTLRRFEVTNNKSPNQQPGMNNLSQPFSDQIWILPRVSTAAFPNGGDDVDPRNSRVLLLHHFVGGWKTRKHAGGEAKTTPLQGYALSLDVTPSNHGFPVTALYPDFANKGYKSVTVFASAQQFPLGYNGLEEGATLTTWGTWQGGLRG